MTRPLQLTLLRGRGMPARTWLLRRWVAVTALSSLVPLAGACAVAGWYLQGQLGVAGPRAQWVEPTRSGDGHWAGFSSLAKSRAHRSMAQLKRRAALSRALRLGLGSRSTASSLLRGTVEPSWQATADRRGPAQGTLLWPVEHGWYVRGYGSGEDGYHLAVDIMGERGTPVRAAEAGIVGYAGNAVRGYGNLILLIHPGGGVTAYAHNDRNHVVAGELVTRGQTIADLGNTGISRGPHVHFEFMRAGKNCDPAPLFRPGVRHRAGHLGAISQTTWGADDKRPKEVACGRRRRHPHSRYGKTAPPAPDGPDLVTLAH